MKMFIVQSKWNFAGALTIMMAAGAMLLTQACRTERPKESNGEIQAAARMEASPASREAESRAAFLAAYKVLMHPRCMNCHPKGEQPLQGEDSHIHLQNVQRGQDGKGLFAMKCKNCHQDKNLPGAEMPPGHPEWHLPPADMRMVFEGKSATELARQIKDPKQNGGRTLEQIVHHSAEDSLVATAWHPGPGRSTPPLSQVEFGKKMREWVDKGAVVP